MSNATVTVQKIYEQIQDLPEESLFELTRYIDFLRFKARAAQTKKKPSSLRIVRLGGLLKGYDFSPEVLAEARREMWKKFKGTRP